MRTIKIDVRFQINNKPYLAIVGVGLFKSSAQIYPMDATTKEWAVIEGNASSICQWLKWYIIMDIISKIQVRFILIKENLRDKFRK